MQPQPPELSPSSEPHQLSSVNSAASTTLSCVPLLHAQQGRDIPPILKPSPHSETKEVRGAGGQTERWGGQPSWVWGPEPPGPFFLAFQIPFEKNCGEDKTCEADLKLTFSDMGSVRLPTPGPSCFTQCFPKAAPGYRRNTGCISLVVQWLRVRFAIHGMRVQSLVRELRSHVPQGN